MVQNIVPAAFLQHAMRIFLASLFAATVWVFVSAATSFAAEPSPPVSDATPADTVGAVQEPLVQAPGLAPKAATLPDLARTAGQITGTAVETAVEGVVDRAMAPAAARSTATSAVRPLSKPASAVVESVIRDSAAVIKPILTAVPLQADVIAGAVPQEVAAPPGAAASPTTPAETAPPAAQDLAPAAYSRPGAERDGQPFGALLPRAVGTPPGGAMQGPAAHPEDGPLPAPPAAGAAGGTNSAGSGPQTPAAGTTDAFSLLFNPASELKTRASAPAPNAPNRNPGFSPD